MSHPAVIWLKTVLICCPCLLLAAAEPLPSSGNSTNDLPPPSISSIQVDGVQLKWQPGQVLELPADFSSLRFTFQPEPGTNSIPCRYRYKLDGVNPDWREPDGGVMRLAIRFFDDAGDWVEERSFPISGESAGWAGAAELSPLQPHQESVIVPANATRFIIAMTSAGPPAAIGTLAISDLSVTRGESTGSATTELLTLQFASSNDVHQAPAPIDWNRSGMRPSMARVLRSAAAPAGWMLAIVDDDINSHAEWLSTTSRQKVLPGQRLTLHWRQCHSIGIGDINQVTYPRLPAGPYRLRVRAVSAAGSTGSNETTVTIQVRLPFWQQPWFWGVVVAGCAALLIATGRAIGARRLRQELEQIKQQKAIEQERLRIAQDLHDDLGARVTQISLLSGMTERETSLTGEARENVAKISRMSRELVSALSEVVWAVSPENDRLDAFADYLCQTAGRFCEETRLRCRLDVPQSIGPELMSSPARHNLVMAVRESLNNSVKHARASEVRIRLSRHDNELTVVVQDDGGGFDPATATAGNGLGNMRQRLETLGGSATIESVPGKGTTVTFRFPIANPNLPRKAEST